MLISATTANCRNNTDITKLKPDFILYIGKKKKYYKASVFFSFGTECTDNPCIKNVTIISFEFMMTLRGKHYTVSNNTVQVS